MIFMRFWAVLEKFIFHPRKCQNTKKNFNVDQICLDILCTANTMHSAADMMHSAADTMRGVADTMHGAANTMCGAADRMCGVANTMHVRCGG